MDTHWLDHGLGANRMFRLGHLMLYDDSEQVEVRYVIALAHYYISIYGGGPLIPEGELYIKRNAICLTKRAIEGEKGTDGQPSRPFYLFSDNCSDKEDFYLALINNQERDASSKPPTPQRFALKDMISLVQKLHSSEENLQTRWFNAGVGRLFLAVYKTSEIAELVKARLTRKIARVKKPAFLSDIVIQSIDLGEGPPYITNPRLKDLTVDGGCSIEVDIDYSGNFKLQVATKARLDLGPRFKAREVDLVLSIVMKKLEGHGIIRFKPPPSNRVWFTFEQMPKLEMSIEPIVSSRQITYTIILRAIESRIREVLAETVVSPNWDDIPFADSSQQRYRGGIWADEESKPLAPETEVADILVDQVDGAVEAEEQTGSVAEDKSDSKPEENDFASKSPARKEKLSPAAAKKDKAAAVSSSTNAKPRLDRPRSWRSPTYATAVTPVVGTDTTTVDAFKEEKRKGQDDAATKMIAITNRCQSNSPATSPVGSPTGSADLPGPSGSSSSTSSKGSRDSDTISSAQVDEAPRTSSSASTRINTDRGSVKSMPGFGNDPKLNTSPSSLTVGSQGSTASRRSLSALTSATASVAKKWGWKGVNKDGEHTSSQQTGSDPNKKGMPTRPIGRGRPLPPPGTPLPPPEKDKSKRNSGGVPNRKPVPSSNPPKNQDNITLSAPTSSATREKRRSASESHVDDGGLLVVAAPADSPPTTPLSEQHEPDYAHSDNPEDEVTPSRRRRASLSKQGDNSSISSVPSTQEETYQPQTTRPASRSFRDDEDARPDWLSAQENDAQARGIWLDPENEHV